MKKLIIFLWFLPVMLMWQNSYIRQTITNGNIIHFWHGTTELFPTSAVVPTYYVSNAGNDSNDGLSDATAWAHHPWMTGWTGSVTLKAGDVVAMKRGNTWSISSPSAPYMTVAQSGTTNAYIKTTAYGVGASPVIKIATATDQNVVYASGKGYLIFDNLHIQHNSSTYNSDQARNGFYLDGVCHNIIFTNNEIDNIPYIAIYGYQNCHHIVVGDTTAISIATVSLYSNHIHDFGYAGVLLEGVNPANSESYFKVCYNYIHDATQTVVPTDEYGIAFSARGTVDISTAWPKYVLAQYNRVENIKTHTGIDMHGGSYIYFLDNYIKNFGFEGFSISQANGTISTALCDNVYVERNIIEQPISGWISGVETAFIDVFADAVGNPCTNIYVENNQCYYTSIPTGNAFVGIRLSYVNGAIVSGNRIYNGDASSKEPAIFLSTAATGGDKNVTISKNFVKQWGSGVDIIGANATGAIAINYNIVTGSTYAPLLIDASNIPSTGAITVYNNDFIQGTYNACVLLNFGIASGGSLILKNNIIGATSSGPLWYVAIEGTVTGTFASNYNLYWNSSSNYFWYAGAGRTWTYWTTTLTFDVNSPNTTASLDPKFTDTGGSYLLDTDFGLGGSSPALNVGTNVSLTTDYLGNPINGTVDIGAIELQ